MIRGLKGARLEWLVKMVRVAEKQTSALIQPTGGRHFDAETREAMSWLQERGLIKPCGVRQYTITHDAVDVYEALEELKAKEQAVTEEAKPDPRKVFIIYGRNTQAFDAMRDFVRALGLEASDFYQIAAALGGSPFIGEVVAEGMKQAQAVVAIFTPDEHAALRIAYQGEHERPEDRERWQARPNVLFEAGMAMGRAPNRTIIVTFGKVSLLSDMDGRHVVRMSNAGEARTILKGRLQGCGCTVNEQVDWLKTGNFDGVTAGLEYDAKAARPEPLPPAPVAAPPPPPANMSDEAIAMALVTWLDANEDTDVATKRPTAWAQIDVEARIPPGSAKRMLEKVLEEPWDFHTRGEEFVRLERGPDRVRVSRTDRYGRRF